MAEIHQPIFNAAGIIGPVERKKGPDVGSKSKRTRYRYRDLLSDQVDLEYCGFEPVEKQDHRNSKSTPLDNASPPQMEITEHEIDPEPCTAQFRKRKLRCSSDIDDPEGDRTESESEPLDIPSGNYGDGDNDGGPDIDVDMEDSWEDELEEVVAPLQDNIRSWTALREQIKDDLKINHKSLPLTKINQLMILRNFATLRLKGVSRIQASIAIAQQWQESNGSNNHFARRIRALARHYQVFEQLPIEKRGGSHVHSLLKDETVRCAARTWLTEQPVGTVTPHKFHHALLHKILPTLGLSLNKPPCERTARRWLIKLGWVRTVVRKGVYMDGHERADVVKYRDEVFLPQMAKYEQKMAHYIPDPSGEGMLRIEPILRPGEREIIAVFQDETCCHANEHTSSAW